jgi:hypothetical protein
LARCSAAEFELQGVFYTDLISTFGIEMGWLAKF